MLVILLPFICSGFLFLSILALLHIPERELANVSRGVKPYYILHGKYLALLPCGSVLRLKILLAL